MKYNSCKMIPVKLTIEGLYSYQGKQTIDFSDLTAAGLFGIFGATGSGKSSILEAVSYVLYGETERMNAREGRNYNMMNLKSDRTYIEFDFRNYEDKLYRATRELKRNSKRFEEVRPPTTVFYEDKGGEWVPLGHTNGELIVGLSYDNFKRTIIIPQGQFREFLELGAADRTRMMKEIFQLHRFDLQDKVKILLTENNTRLDFTEGRLKGYEEITEEGLKRKQKEWEEGNRRWREAEEKHKVIDARYQKMRHLKEDFQNLQDKRKTFTELGEREGGIKDRNDRLKKYERMFLLFSQRLKEDEKLRENRVSLQRDREKTLREITDLKQSHAEKQKERAEVTPWYEQLAEKQREEEEWGMALKIKDLWKEWRRLEDRIRKGTEKVTEVQTGMAALQKEVAETEARLTGWRSQRMEAGLGADVKSWFLIRERMEKEMADREIKREDIRKRMESLLRELKERNIESENFLQDAAAELQNLETAKNALEKERNELEVRQRMARFAHELHDGEPCPLCGSTDHPDIAETEDVTEDLRRVDGALAKYGQEISEAGRKKTEVEKALREHEIYQTQLASVSQEQDRLNVHYQAHLKGFRWKDFDPEDAAGFSHKLEESTALERKIMQEEKILSEKRDRLEKDREDLEKYQKALDDFRLASRAKKAASDSHTSHLRILNFGDFQEKPVEEIEKQREELAAKNREVESRYMSLQTEIHQLETRMAGCDAERKSTEVQLGKTEKEIEVLETEIQEKLRAESLQSREEVLKILGWRLEIEQEKEAIEKFYRDFAVLQNQIEELTRKLTAAEFEMDTFEREEQLWRESEAELKQMNNQVVEWHRDLQQMQHQYEEKTALLKEKDGLARRGENLRILFNLFKGQGFVEYISTMYLSQLCDHANVRFRRMTRHQLSLQLGENNDFEIIDYLNEGRSRSVKTLSGGQSFQVSLSLALALAESVQTNAVANKNFFFIDEGFGTQDPESINIIFETLVNLNKENKIVGIISHVEELKDRIPFSLTIVKDPEKGSLIQYS